MAGGGERTRKSGGPLGPLPGTESITNGCAEIKGVIDIAEKGSL